MDPDAVHYAALGLSEEASIEEIRLAYRRLAKVYHPDQDASLDAQVRYTEVRAAYEALKNKAGIKPVQKPSQANHDPSQSAGNASYAHSDFQYDFTSGAYNARRKVEDEFYLFGWRLNVNGERKIWPRRPFSLKALPAVIVESIDEVAGFQIIFRAVLSGYLHWSMLARFSVIWASFFIFISLLGSAVFRYYYTRGPLDKGVYFRAAGYYGAGASVLFLTRDFFLGYVLNWVIIIKFVDYAVLFYLSILPLWIHPLIWSAKRCEGR